MVPELHSQPTVRPDRGGTILALGIVSCFAALFWLPLGILPWILGSRDLKEMDEGVLDPGGRRATQAGRTFGIVSTVLAVVMIGIGLIVYGGQVVTVGP